MKVLFFGTYDRQWQFNKGKINGLRKIGVEVEECHEEVWNFDRNKRDNLVAAKSMVMLFFLYLLSIPKLFIKFFQKRNFDAVIVSYPGNFDLVIAKFLCFVRRKPLIYNPFISAYEAIVFQRKYLSENSIRAKLFFWLDKIPMMLADKIIADTNANADFFSETFNIPREKFRRVFVGVDENFIFREKAVKKKSNKFTVLFYGSFRPGQGLKTIVKAARLLSKSQEIKFVLAGSGPMLKEIKESTKNFKNVELTGWLAKDKLARLIANADVCLGQFSELEKIDRVIPTKAFECLALGKPFITGEGKGIRELVEAGKDTILVKKNSELVLVNAILSVKKDAGLSKKLSENAIAKYESEFTDERIGGEMLNIVESAIKPKLSK